MEKDNIFFNGLLERFEIWWKNDEHRKNMTKFDGIITKEHLSSLSDEDFVAFFYQFVGNGGYVQSGGERTKNRFKESLASNLHDFRQFILLPFENNFSLERWFKEIEKHSYFGVGIATIFLNRVDRNRFVIMNNKTIQALRLLGYSVGSTKDWQNYKKIIEIQKNWVNSYQILENFYKSDALNHFVVAVKSGQEFVNRCQEFPQAINEIEQDELSVYIKNSEKEYLLSKLLELEKIQNYFENKSEKLSDTIEIHGIRYKRNNYLMSLIKAYRGYACQFCQTKIPKKDGGFYIEACHIKPKHKNGEDTLSNILTLCPNCHKLFDLNERIDEKISDGQYQVIINSTQYCVNLE